MNKWIVALFLLVRVDLALANDQLASELPRFLMGLDDYPMSDRLLKILDMRPSGACQDSLRNFVREKFSIKAEGGSFTGLSDEQIQEWPPNFPSQIFRIHARVNTPSIAGMLDSLAWLWFHYPDLYKAIVAHAETGDEFRLNDRYRGVISGTFFSSYIDMPLPTSIREILKALQLIPTAQSGH